MLINYQEIEINELEIVLPASKSITNRALIIQQLCLDPIILNNISEAEDSKIVQNLLTHKSLKKHVGMAGTAARFLSAYLATQKADFVITGDDKMQERPMKPLLEALMALGATIEYLGKDGYLPIKINGSQIKGGKLSLDSSISSQFVSALMMIAPVLDGGLQIGLKGKISSKPYIIMTQKIMEYFGIKVQVEADCITIKPQKYIAKELLIDSDWSAASYFYSALAMMDEGSLLLKNLSFDSWQGDSIVADIYYRLGILTSMNGDDVLLEKSENVIDFFEYDFSDCPDLAQTVICTCVGLGIEAEISGIHTLVNKETDRIKALQTELKKFNWTLEETQAGIFELKRSKSINNLPIKVQTYNDHRMAMSFAPLVIMHGEMEIENEEVVKKSFPSFWDEMEKLGVH